MIRGTEMRDNRPATYGWHGSWDNDGNFTGPVYKWDCSLITDETKEVQEVLSRWIKKMIIPRNTRLRKYTNDILQEYFERDTGISLTANQFKDGMMVNGYPPTSYKKYEWHFCISECSPALKMGRKKGDWDRS